MRVRERKESKGEEIYMFWRYASYVVYAYSNVKTL